MAIENLKKALADNAVTAKSQSEATEILKNGILTKLTSSMNDILAKKDLFEGDVNGLYDTKIKVYENMITALTNCYYVSNIANDI